MKRPRAKLPVNRWCSEYLMACYLYYNGAPALPFSDEKFGMLCKKIYKHWDKITHPDQHLITKEALKAETGFDIKYTNMIKNAAKQWADNDFR